MRFGGRLALLATAMYSSGCFSPAQPEQAHWPVIGFRLDSFAETPLGEPASSYAMLESTNGRIALFEKTAVNIFDAKGQLLARLGRDGSGPLEFQLIAYTGKVSGELFWIWDTRLRRLTLVDMNSLTLIQEPVAYGMAEFGTSLVDWSGPRARTIDGSTLLSGARRGGAPLPGEPEGIVMQTLFAWFPADGSAPIVSVLRPKSDCAIEVDGGRYSRPECPKPDDDISPDGRLIIMAAPDQSQPDGYTFDLLSVLGDTIWSRNLQLHGAPFTQEHHQAWLERMARYPGVGEQIPIPDRLAPLRRVQVGSDSTVWVQGILEGQRRAWNLISSQGEPIGLVWLDDELWVQEVSRHGALVSRDLENGQIVLYRLVLDGN